MHVLPTLTVDLICFSHVIISIYYIRGIMYKMVDTNSIEINFMGGVKNDFFVEVFVVFVCDIFYSLLSWKWHGQQW